METRASENVVHKIIIQIINSSAEKGISISEELAIYILKTVLINPENLFNIEVVQTKHEVDRIVKTCVDRICNRTPSLDTIKMQVYFTLNYATREEFLEEHYQALNSRLRPLIEDILNKRPKTRQDIFDMYEKIVLSIMLWSGLGSPNHLKSISEATTALQSVFPQTELGKFLVLNKLEKERQLEELRYIVTGICLYNWNCGKGGSGIENLPRILKQLLPEFQALLSEEIDQFQGTAFFSLAVTEQIDESQFDFGERELIWEANINARQAIIYIKLIKKHAMESIKQVESITRNLTGKIAKLQTTIQSKLAIPTSQVYPLFIQIANIWKNLQYEKVLLSLLHNIVLNLQAYTQGSKILMEGELGQKFKDQVVVKTDSERYKESFKDTTHFLPFGQYLNVEICDPSTIVDLDKLLIAYQGFCSWELCKKQCLIFGNRKRFLAMYKSVYYTFSASEYLKEFAEDPDWFIKETIEISKFQPDLIQLLQLQSKIYPSKMKRKQKSALDLSFSEKMECAIQTELHPIEQYIDPDYEWNEWKLRKKGITLANLRKKSTHSSQTNESHLRRENSSQIYVPKINDSQTVEETGANTLRENHFLMGIRGYRNGKLAPFQYLDLTEELK